MLLREFFLGFIKIHILYHAGKEPVYGAALITELARHGYEVSPGTLYPTLHRLERLGYLVSYQENVEGKIRKYYRLTDEGRQALDQLRPKIIELVSEVIPEWVARGYQLSKEV